MFGNSPEGAVAAGRRNGSGEDLRNLGLFHLDDNVRAGHRRADPLQMLHDAGGQGLGNVAARTAVQQGPFPVMQIQIGCHGQRSAALQLQL